MAEQERERPGTARLGPILVELLISVILPSPLLFLTRFLPIAYHIRSPTTIVLSSFLYPLARRALPHIMAFLFSPSILNLAGDIFLPPLLLLMLPPIAAVSSLFRSARHFVAWSRQQIALAFGTAGLIGRVGLSSKDKVVIVTGASSGIGRQMALEYARRGALLMLVARRVEKLEEVARACREEGAADALVHRADLASPEACQKMVQAAVDHFGRIDVLVNNAGAAHSGLFQSYRNVKDFNSVMTIDFWGNAWPMLYALPHLSRSQGQVFVTASAAAFLTYPRQSFYNAAKSAVVQFYDSLRVEPIAMSGIAVTVAMPGFIHSEMTDKPYAASHIPWFWPMLSAEAAAYHMVDAAERRQHYVFVPLWYTTWLPYRVFAPEIMDWCQRVLLLGQPPSAYIHDVLASVVGEDTTKKLFSIMSAIPAKKVA